MNVSAGSIQHEGTKYLLGRGAHCPCRMAEHSSSGSVLKAAGGKPELWLSWAFENKGRKIGTLGDSTQALPGRNREVGREANSDERTQMMELKYVQRAKASRSPCPVIQGRAQSHCTRFADSAVKIKISHEAPSSYNEFPNQPNFPRNFGQTKMSTPKKKGFC